MYKEIFLFFSHSLPTFLARSRHMRQSVVTPAALSRICSANLFDFFFLGKSYDLTRIIGAHEVTECCRGNIFTCVVYPDT